ncbi:hypothetical protein LCI18_014572 [Fusarium solani-melongenae]|uniref:Uncharacterized protein n=1 Tax=Fusarium solani subsp. cucurbitae TaxID=2747967 RepID=A0ACD3ZR01_FUSSC|nr:hypothetical protein LCI18_014572 [Fusarium solani-melongenae]
MGAVASVDHLGRRMLFLISAWGMLVSFIIISGLSGGFATTGTAAICIAVIPFLYIYYAFYDIALICHIAEIWPYQLRARGMALGQMSTYFAIFFNVFVNPIVLEAIAWKYYLIYVAILIIFVLNIYFCYPETKGYTLEEMAVIFDGQQGPAILEGVATKAKAKAVEAQLDEVP